LYALTLGIIQGITEFLPISSSAHLILFSTLYGGKTLPLTLNVALHMGTFVAVLIYFWRDWLLLSKGSLRWITRQDVSADKHARLLPILIFGCVPAAIIGILWEKQIEAIFHNPQSTLIPLAIVGVMLWYVDRRSAQVKNLSSMSIKDGLLVGIAQAMALIPGTSRSGITILAARMLGYDRESAARFSFLLGTPVMAGAVLLNLKDIGDSFSQPVFYVGAITSAIVGCFAIGFLLRFIKRFGFAAFAVYRVVLAVIIFLMLR
jgi:undecaprenyl-diphosphatase